MEINATFLGQAVAFLIFAVICMKYVWPPLLGAIEKRQKEIADGLDSAEKAILFIYKYSELKPNGGTIDDVLDLIQNANKRYYCVSNTIMQSGKTITKLKEINIAPLKHEQVKSNIGKHFAAIQTFFSNLGVKVNFVNEFDKDLFNFEIAWYKVG